MDIKKQTNDELDAIAQVEDSENELFSEARNHDILEMQQEMTVDINNLSINITSLEKRFDCFEQSIKKSKTTADALASLSLQNSKFQENFHGREVLMPVLQSLINIAVRGQEQITRFTKHQEQSAKSLRKAAEKAFQFMLKARTADIAEIHDTLALFSVEPFTTEEETFDPSTQKAIQRIETEDTALSQKIAERLHPGYARGGQIIRREYVTVYYLKS